MYHFVYVEMTKSTKNILVRVIETLFSVLCWLILHQDNMKHIYLTFLLMFIANEVFNFKVSCGDVLNNGSCMLTVNFPHIIAHFEILDSVWFQNPGNRIVFSEPV